MSDLLVRPRRLRFKPLVRNLVAEARIDARAFVMPHFVLREAKAVEKIDAMPGIRREVRYMALQHHENGDGSGYPDGIKMNAIKSWGRILRIVDSYEAMTTNRPYQAAMDPEYVVRIINSLANTKFDPRVVAAESEDLVRNLQAQGKDVSLLLFENGSVVGRITGTAGTDTIARLLDARR